MYGGIGRGWERFGRGLGEASGGSANGTSIRGTALETFRRHVMLLGEVYGVCWFVGRRLSDILDHRETFKGHFGSFGDV